MPDQTAVTTIAPINLRFTIWSANSVHLDLLNEVAEAYYENHPEVTIQFDIIPPGDYAEKVSVQLAGENPPDLGWIREDSALAFIATDSLENLRPTLVNYPGYNLADFSPSSLELWSQGDALYAIPFSTSPYFILYNKDLFQIAGVPAPDSFVAANNWTWKTVAEIASQIAKATPPEIYGFEGKDGAVYTDRAWQTLIPIIWAYGGDAWNSDGTECLLDSDAAITAVTLYHDMVFKDHSAVPPGVNGDFYSGLSAMTISQLSRSARLEDAGFDMAIAPLPGGPGQKEPMAIGQAGVSVFNAGFHRGIAADFVAFMTNQNNSEKLAIYFPPARLTVLASPEFLEANPLLDSPGARALIATAINTGSVLPSHPNFPVIDLATRDQFQALWEPDADISAVMENICQSITPLLSR
ncbi:MAG: sugar ABC transporter substrate-binding protein [Candidatus Promineifilaceae bacterium]